MVDVGCVGDEVYCFDPSELRAADFDPYKFVVDKRKHVPISTLKSDLDAYLEALKKDVMHRINNELYDSFFS
eukprot:gene5918-5814_t